MRIGLKQKQIIDISKKIISHDKYNENENDKVSALTYFALWGTTPGFERIKFKLFGLKSFIRFSLSVLKDIIGIAYLEKIEIIKNKNFKAKNFKKIILSRSMISNFDKNNNYVDRYFLINSKNEQKTLFLLLHSDIRKPKKISKNIVLLCLEKKNINLFFLIKYLLKKIKYSHFSIREFFKQTSSFIRTGELINNFFNKEIELKTIDFILTPYEGQPYENMVFNEVKKKNKRLITAGYDHSAPHSIPIHLIHRNFSPDLLFLNGSSQIDFLNKFLKWPKKKLKLVPSLRYTNKMKQRFNDQVFLPYEIFNEKSIIKDFKKIISRYYNNDLRYLKIKNHPLMTNSKKHKQLTLKLESVIKSSKNNKIKKDKKKTAIFIGPTTGAIVALEKNLRVIHICFDPLFDSYSQRLWPNLKVSQITKNSFIYKLNKRNSFINFSNSKTCYKKYYEVKK
jgi:hypothetical protein